MRFADSVISHRFIGRRSKLRFAVSARIKWQSPQEQAVNQDTTGNMNLVLLVVEAVVALSHFDLTLSMTRIAFEVLPLLAMLTTM